MPSVSKKQARFMKAISHGWKPSRMKNPPSRKVAREFVEADMYNEEYQQGGLAQAVPQHAILPPQQIPPRQQGPPRRAGGFPGGGRGIPPEVLQGIPPQVLRMMIAKQLATRGGVQPGGPGGMVPGRQFIPRIGGGDQQGALARAVQTRTGRPPISRRMPFPGRRPR